MTWWIGVDVGGTKSAGVLMDGLGGVHLQCWSEHAGRGLPLAEAVLRCVRELQTEAGIDITAVSGVGVAIAGLINEHRDTVVHAAILDAVDVPLTHELTTLLAAPVILENDANATLLGHAFGPGSGSAPADTDVTVLIALGTGVGGAVLIGDEPLSGSHGFAGELGHLTVDFDSRRICSCGSTGCLASFAGGWGLQDLARHHPHPDNSIAPSGSVDARRIVELAREENTWATELLHTAGRMLGRAITSLSITLDPRTIVLGGSLGHAAYPWLVPAAEAEMTRLWPFPRQRPLTEIVLDRIGPYAAATGAAVLARRRLGDRLHQSTKETW